MATLTQNHTTRSTGTVLTANIYNDDHDTHIQNVLGILEEPFSPSSVTDSGTDAYQVDWGVDVGSDDIITGDVASANTTNTPTLENIGGTPSGAKTITLRDGSAVWPGAINGVHTFQLASGGGSWLVLDPNREGVVDPEHATDSGTDTYDSATNTSVPGDGVQIVRDFQSANTTTTPTLDGKTITDRDGNALWSGAISGVHSLQRDETADTYLLLYPIGTDANVNNAPVKRDSNGRAKFADPSAAQDVGTKIYIDNHSPINLVTDFGADDTGSSSVTTAFNDAVSSAVSDDRKILIPSGTFNFESKPNDITSPVNIEGVGINRTYLVRDYNEGGGNNTGLIHVTVGADGSKIGGLTIVAESGTSGGCALAIYTGTTTDVSWNVLYDMRLSTRGNDNWGAYTLVLDGTSNDTGALGIRDNVLRNINVFGAPTHAVKMSGANGTSWHGGFTASAGGSSGSLQITGTSSVTTNNCNISLSTIGGDLNISQCNLINVSAPIGGDIVNFSNANKVVVLGYVDGTVQTNWTNSSHYG